MPKKKKKYSDKLPLFFYYNDVFGLALTHGNDTPHRMHQKPTASICGCRLWHILQIAYHDNI